MTLLGQPVGPTLGLWGLCALGPHRPADSRPRLPHASVKSPAPAMFLTTAPLSLVPPPPSV